MRKPSPRPVRSGPGFLAFKDAAARHVALTFRRPDGGAADTARAAACYDLSMLAFGYHEHLSPRAATMTAACLLAVAAELENSGGGPALEPEASSTIPDTVALERDAALLGGTRVPLTQARLAQIFAHFDGAIASQGLDLLACLQTAFGAAGRPRADFALVDLQPRPAPAARRHNA